MSEVSLWNWLKPYCPQGHYTRVETGESGPGTPDVNYRIARSEGWFELKFAKSPGAEIPFPNEDSGVRKSQKIWIREHVSFGGNVHIVAQVGDLIYFIPGKSVDRFNGANIRRLKHLSVLILDRADPAPTFRKLRWLMGDFPL